MYPMIKEGVSLGTFTHKNSTKIHYYVENANGEEFEISYSIWRALLEADGTKPLKVADKGKKIIPFLKKHDLIQTSRFVRDEGIFNRFVLFPISDKSRRKRKICKVVNTLLPITAFVLCILGIIIILTRGFHSDQSINWWLYYSLFIGSLVVHETGHFAAGIAYGYRISDVGILLLGVIPVGAYVAHHNKKNASKAEKIQFALAGVEANLVLIGACLIAAALVSPWSYTFFTVAINNAVLVVINLLPTSGLDGESVLSAVFEIDSISEAAKKCLTKKELRRKLFDSGFSGIVCFGILSISMFSKAILWLIIGLNIILICFCLL